MWDKTEVSRPLLGFNAQSEYIVWGTRGPIDLGHKVYLPGLIRAAAPRGKTRTHITQKSLGLMEKLVEIAPPGGFVLDPFAGSGTTLEAARNKGRNAIGLEIDKNYFDLSETRMRQQSLGEAL